MTDIETVIVDALDHQITAAIAAQKETLTHTLQVAATVIGNVRTDTHRRATVAATAIGTVTEALTAETPDVTMTRDRADETESLTMTVEEEDERGAMMDLQDSQSSHVAAHHPQRRESPPLI